jgi:hypothetical protein
MWGNKTVCDAQRKWLTCLDIPIDGIHW